MVRSMGALFGSPVQFFNTATAKTAANTGGAFVSKAISAASDTVTNFLRNGFVNPLSYAQVAFQLIDTDLQGAISFGGGVSSDSNAVTGFLSNVVDAAGQGISGLTGGAFGKGYTPFTTQLLLKANTSIGYRTMKGEVVRVSRPI